MIARDLADVLSTGGMGTVGTTVFYDELPDNVDTGVVVVETGGMASVHAMSSGPATTIGAGVAKAERPRVQVMTRSPVHDTARAKAQDAFNLLDGLRDRTVNGHLIQFVRSVQSPFSLGRDLNNRARYACNFDVTKFVSSSTTT